MVDYVYFMAAGKVIAQGTPGKIRASPEPYVNQFVNGKPDGPDPFHYPAPDYAADLKWFRLDRAGSLQPPRASRQLP